MKIAFCTTCKGRVEHIRQTLPKNLADNADYPDCKFILLDYNSGDGLDTYIKENFQAELQSGRLVFYQLREKTAFKMGHAKNMAHRCGLLENADILVNLDADNFTGQSFAKYIQEYFDRTRLDPQEIFLWPRMLKGILSKGISGRICVTRNAFLLAGGYDEKFTTHSPDDRDFLVRLRRLGYCAQEIDSRFLLAINHNDKVRFREYPELQKRPANYNDSYKISPASRVVNYGYIGCGTVYRNFSETPTVLGRIPTRIFGIGTHKTATTSLHAALEILGFKSGHWENAHWAKAIWNEMEGLGSSLTVEKFYALSDLPIPMLFRQLDQTYPGSKFILTIRDEKDWLNSARNHWSYEMNPRRAMWDEDPFTHKIHSLLYGRKKFDEAIMLAKYREHNAAVLSHFADRPQDLLVMDMSKGAGWKELCGFLKVAVPSMEYPVKLKTKCAVG